jgi:hypothetical protein
LTRELSGSVVGCGAVAVAAPLLTGALSSLPLDVGFALRVASPVVPRRSASAARVTSVGAVVVFGDGLSVAAMTVSLDAGGGEGLEAHAMANALLNNSREHFMIPLWRKDDCAKCARRNVAWQQ